MPLFLIPFWEVDNSPKYVLFSSSVAQYNHVLSASVNHYLSFKEFLESSNSIQSLGEEATYYINVENWKLHPQGCLPQESSLYTDQDRQG